MIKPTVSPETEEIPLCDEDGPIPTFPSVAVDPATGRILPMSEEERAARRSAALRAIKAISQITDETDTDEIWQEMMRDLDAQRPHRKLFEGMY